MSIEQIGIEHIGIAAILVPLLVGLWAHATGRERIFRFLVGTLMFAIASLLSMVTLGFAYLAVEIGGVAMLLGLIAVPIGVLSLALWARFFTALGSRPEPKP